MRDGVRLAIDVHVPQGFGLPDRMPAMLRQTRYLRSLSPKGPLGQLVTGEFDLYRSTRKTFLRAGYVWIDVDVRGTGASTGAWKAPWFEDEVRDGADLVNWIIAQPWSNGRVGSLGISYDGTAAEMLLVNNHPAVRAVAPMFSLYDVFADVAFPGGVHLAWFTQAWSRYNGALDRSAFSEAWVTSLRLIARVAANDPSPQGGARILSALGSMDESLFKKLAAVALETTIAGGRSADGHYRAPNAEELSARLANLDVHAGALKLVFRDDTGLVPTIADTTIDDFSPHKYRSEITSSGAAIYSYSGWRDGAYQASAVRRYSEIKSPGARLTLGPWVHSGKLRIHAGALATPAEFDHDAELLDFFEQHLKDAPEDKSRLPIRYFRMGDEKWLPASTWPPLGTTVSSLYATQDRRLSPESPAVGPVIEQPVDSTVGTGERSRWRSLLSLVPGDYPDRRERDQRLLCFDSDPLPSPLAVAGSPRVIAHVAWSDPGAARLFAYLEEVTADGQVIYVTEGQLLAMHRGKTEAEKPTFRRADAQPVIANEVVTLAIDLLPIAYLFRTGSRVRLALSAADADHFAAPQGAGVFRVTVGKSRVELPGDFGGLR
jgi:hypothetical protein